MDKPDTLIEKKSKSELIGKGCLVQGMGLLMPILFAAITGPVGGGIGLVLLFVLLIVGSGMLKKWLCGRCMSPLPNKGV